MDDLPEAYWWIIVVEWKNGTHSFLRVQGLSDGPDMGDLFWRIDEEGDPYSAKIWFTKSKSDIHICQDKDGTWFANRINADVPLDRYVFPDAFVPARSICTCKPTCSEVCTGDCGCKACEIRFRNHRPDE